mmetsp:Transcript_14848/g.24560  ORF Transcript_14848/g.24560 Transcript_14848/m.24560 type:complete len:175 (+) Transcript_14848:185-709(+)|eukprot:CAMPEP_0119010636 /NCGR_PEP_ID=MMETSP1176-20130426/5141_1 /TAXON_ID=265551 /ORGANISM="Synedropsis recta cf, Strain CCMP1620" /LENGTH=174 /DNA_ID=CAMNT_0006963335 /DNA_START=161 /DNA_END=685 /DNA_ORIENTATION=-
MTTPASKTKDAEYSKLNQAEQGTVASAAIAVAVPIVKATSVKITKKVQEITTSGDRPHPPPFGLPEGGTWGTNTHHGSKTCSTSAVCCICCGGIPACIICCFPFDKRRVYMIDRKVYDANGSFIGTGYDHFRDEEFDGAVDQKQMHTALMFAGIVGVIGTILFISLQLSSDPNY